MSFRTLLKASRFWMLIVLCSLLVPACTGVFAADLDPVRAQAWRMDKTGQASLQDMQNASDWQAFSGLKSWGYGPETIWVRLQLRAAKPDAPPWVVRVRPAFLDRVTLYDPASGLVLHTGDALTPDEDDITSINFSLQIPALPHERTVYLQVRSTSSRTLQIDVLPYGQAQQLNHLQEWLLGFVIAVSAIFALLAFVQWLLTQEPVIGVFALKQTFATVSGFLLFGFARIVIGPWLPEGMLTAISSTVFPWTIGLTTWFFLVLLRSYQLGRWGLQVLRILIVLDFLLPALQWFDLTSVALAIGTFSISLVMGIITITLLTAMPKQIQSPPSLAVLLIYVLVYCALNTMASLIFMGWMEARQMVLFGNFALSLLDGFFMFVMLQIRARHVQQTQQKIALDLAYSQQQAETEKRHRHEQSQLFAMLAHEMKTSLATLRMWMDAGQLKPETMARAIADMNSVIERCVHTGQLADQGLRPSAQAVDPVALSLGCITTCRAPERVDWQAPPSSGPLHTDAQMLSIVLGNLLDNACKYSAAGSRIQLSLEQATRDGQRGWLWQVRNQAGPAGLPDAAHLFEKYYRSPHARRLSGSGLGLFLVKGLLELMQGHIAYEAHDAQAVFSIWLPAQLTAR